VNELASYLHKELEDHPNDTEFNTIFRLIVELRAKCKLVQRKRAADINIWVGMDGAIEGLNDAAVAVSTYIERVLP